MVIFGMIIISKRKVKMKLTDRIKTFLVAGGVALAGIGIMTAAEPVYADSWTDEIQSGMDATGLTDNKPLATRVSDIIKVILYIVGILAVVMIIIGGIQYTTSAGDQNAVTKAKNTILYGIVGLVIAVLAYAIVSFVVTKLSGPAAGPAVQANAIAVLVAAK